MDRERGGGGRGVERQRRTTVVTQKLGATMAVRLLAPWSLPTRLPARVPQELAYLVHGVLPYGAILQSTPPREHYSLRVRFPSPGLSAEATITRPFTPVYLAAHRAARQIGAEYNLPLIHPLPCRSELKYVRLE